MTNGPWKWNGSILVDADGICIGVGDLMTPEHRRAVAALPDAYWLLSDIREAIDGMIDISDGEVPRPNKWMSMAAQIDEVLAKLEGI